jgi:hypothetical protein
MSLFAGLLMVAALTAVSAPAGVAQTSGCVDINGPAYCPEPTPVTTTQPTKAQLRKKCILKAQTKFGDNRVKLKKAIKKCKKKYR